MFEIKESDAREDDGGGISPEKQIDLAPTDNMNSDEMVDPTYCHDCLIPLNSVVIAQSHYSGAKHKKKLKSLNKTQQTPPSPK